MAWHGSAQMFLSTPTLRIYSLLFKSYTMVIKFTLSLTIAPINTVFLPLSISTKVTPTILQRVYRLDGWEAPCWRSRARAMHLALSDAS